MSWGVFHFISYLHRQTWKQAAESYPTMVSFHCLSLSQYWMLGDINVITETGKTNKLQSMIFIKDINFGIQVCLGGDCAWMRLVPLTICHTTPVAYHLNCGIKKNTNLILSMMHTFSYLLLLHPSALTLTHWLNDDHLMINETWKMDHMKWIKKKW